MDAEKDLTFNDGDLDSQFENIDFDDLEQDEEFDEADLDLDELEEEESYTTDESSDNENTHNIEENTFDGGGFDFDSDSSEEGWDTEEEAQVDDFITSDQQSDTNEEFGFEEDTDFQPDESSNDFSISADDDGTIISGDALLNSDDSDDEYHIVEDQSDFISDTGDIVVMERGDKNEDSFDLQYIDIKMIGLTAKRIRTNRNVDDLVRSIKSTGLLHPIVVAPAATEGYYILLHGFRRILACAKAGILKIPCIVNNKVNTTEIPVLEAMYNHNKSYSIKEIIDYIDYLEKEKGILSATMIEYLLQMNSGDYTKLKDILNDDDEDIVSKLMEGQFTIEQAFKKLEQRRKKESAEEKALKKAEKVYEDETESGVGELADSGETANETSALSEEEVKEITSSLDDLDSDEESIEELVDQGNNIDGYKPNVQDVHDREKIDPAIKEAALQRDGYKCRCCEFGGPGLKSVMDYHHVLPVFLGGADTVENGVTLCLTCHNLIHQWSFGKLNLVNIKEMDEATQLRFKKIIKLGNIIREGMSKQHKRPEDVRKEHKLSNVGRRMPGSEQGGDI